jgi:hypothetical protein
LVEADRVDGQPRRFSQLLDPKARLHDPGLEE